MKRVVIFTIGLSLCGYSASLSHKEITKMVSKIKDERVGISLATLDTTPNPFVIVKRVEKKVEVKKEVKPKKKVVIKPLVTYEITAVLNHSAFINGKWYKVGDKIGEYKVVHIGKSSAVLRGTEGVKKLQIERKIKKFKMFKGN